MNRLGLTDEVRAVESYSDSIKSEIMEKNARKVVSLGGLRLYECPQSYFTEDTFDIMRVVFLTEQTGAMLFSGGTGDQPLWLIEAFEIYRTEKMLQAKKSDLQK